MNILTLAIFLFGFFYANISEYVFRDYHSEYSIKRVAIRAACFMVIMAVVVGVIL